MLFIWAVVALVMAALWWLDRSRAGAVLRAVGEDELAAQSTGINITAVKVSAMTIGGVIAGIGGGIFAHYTTHIEHVQFGVVLATFAIAYPILGGLSNVFGTLLAVIFIQGFLIEGLRFMGDWRNLLFGGLIVLAMNVRPRGLLDAGAVLALKRLLSSTQGSNRCLISKASASISAAFARSMASISRSRAARSSASSARTARARARSST